MEGDYDGYADDRHVDGEAQVGEECAFIGAVVTGVAVCVVEEEGAEERGDAEDLAAVGMSVFLSVCIYD